MTPGSRELEGVLQQVRHRRRQQLRVAVDGQFGIDGSDAELDLPVLGMEDTGRGDLVKQRHHEHALAHLFSGGEPHL
jgi:hypothetical protein